MTEAPLPPEFGPVLARACAVPPAQRTLCWITLSGFSGFVIVFCRLRGCDWWWSLGTAGAMFAVLYICNFKASVRAGDGWFASNNGFLRTDKLTRVCARVILSGTYVALWDADGRHLDIPLSELTNDAKIWELVRAGVGRSRVAGLVADDNLAARIFGLSRRSSLIDYAGPSARRTT